MVTSQKVQRNPDIAQDVELEPLHTVIADIFEQRVVSGHALGSCFALFGTDGVLFEGGFGHRRPGSPAPDGNTVFRIASCTKSFTSAVLLLLRDRGLLHLDSAITAFVPEFVSTAPETDPVTPTVRMLMTMSAGLPTDDPWGDRQESMTKAGLAHLLRAGVPFVSIPGTRFEYSNLGYALLGQVIEIVTGRPYIDVVRSELIEPLGLSSTGYTVSEFSIADVASGYRKKGEEWLELPFSGPGVFSPMGGLFSTPHDLATWARWLSSALHPETVIPGPLSAASRREMQQISRLVASAPTGHQSVPMEHGYGYGLFVDHEPMWGNTTHHSGGYPGFSTHMRWNEHIGIGIVGFENATYSNVKKPVSDALDRVVEYVGSTAKRVTPWPEMQQLRRKVESLLGGWNDHIANEVFADNVALDKPYAERVVDIAEAIDAVEGVYPNSSLQQPEFSGDSPAHLLWYLPGRSGRLRCEVRLAPTNPPLIQTFEVSAEVD